MGSATTANAASATTLTLSAPSSVAEGDLLLACTTLHNGSGADNYPSLTGWTTAASGSFESGGADHRFAVLYHAYGTGEPSSYVFTVNGGSSADGTAGGMVAFSGVNTNSPFDVTPGSITTGAGTSLSGVSSLTTATANDAILLCVGAFESETLSSFNTATAPGSLTTLFWGASNGNGTVGIGWGTLAVAGSTGAGSATASANKGWGAILLALKPGATAISATNSLAVSRSLVASNTPVTVTMNLGASSAVLNVAPSALTVNTTGGASATLVSGPTPTSKTVEANGDSFSWVYNVVSGTGAGTVSFTGSASSASTNFAAATSPTVIVTPPLTWQVVVTNSANPITNVAFLQDTSGAIPTTPSQTVTNMFSGSLGFLVWADLNGDGVPNSGEPGLANITVYISATNGVPIANGPQALTSVYGQYLINNLTTGIVYTVTYVSSNLYGYFPSTPASLNVTLTHTTEYFTNANFGLEPSHPGVPGSTIGSVVWLDGNNNGIQDNGEVGLSNVTVQLSAAQSSATNFTIASITISGDSAVLTWGGGQPPYVVQQSSAIGPEAVWQAVGQAQSGTQMVIPLTNRAGFFRVSSGGN